MSYNTAKVVTLARANPTKFPWDGNDIAAVAVETDLAAMEREWRDFEKSAAGYVFQSFDWISAWHNTVGRTSGTTPLIVTGRGADGRLIFLLPLGVKRRCGLTALTWLGGDEADLKGGLFDPAFLARVTDLEWHHLWQRIRMLFPGVDLIRLSDQPERIGQQRNPFILWRTPRQPDQTHGTWLGRDWTAYYDAKRGHASRREDRRRARKLEALGKLEFSIVRDPGGIRRTLDKLIADKAKLLARMGVDNPFDTDAVRDFMSRQAERMHPVGTTHLSMIALDGAPISVVWGHVAQKRFYYLLSAYDMEYSHFAPGTRHLQHLMRWCMDNAVDYFDFGVGEQDYKFEWCEDHIPLFASLQGASWPGRAAVLVLGVKVGFKHFVKTSKVLWPLAQRVRALLFSRLRRAE